MKVNTGFFTWIGKKWNGKIWNGGLRMPKWSDLRYYGILVLSVVLLATAAYGLTNRAQHNVQNAPSIPIAVSSEKLLPLTSDQTEDKPHFLLPGEGRWIQSYSEAPIWSETLCQWETHTAVDYAMQTGAPVCAPSDGIVTGIDIDPLLGGIVSMETDSGIHLRYASMNVLKTLQSGDKISQGEIIGYADTCPIEAELGAHIHIQCSREDQPLNFRSLL